LRQSAGQDATSSSSDPSSDGDKHGHGAPPVVVAPSTYAELRDATGAVLTRIQLNDTTAQPALPSTLPSEGSIFTASSSNGSGEWRVLVSAEHDGGPGDTADVVLTAIPTTEVTSALHRLVFIELGSAGGLLLILGTGAWFILRRGLRPLEAMATTAGSFTAGALDQRVESDDSRGEIGQLGLAINTMLAELEAAFHERDVTEQRLRQFLADASHELRTPLTSIQGFAELFRLGHDNVDLPVILRRIEEESARMKLLVDDLLLLARLDQTRAIERSPVDLSVLAADACTDAIAADPDRSVTLDAPQPAIVQGDQTHLRQAVANLLTNALRHTPAGSAIEVSVTLDDVRATITVRDHGPGLDGDALEHAFDRFWQADPARSTKGAGLGLAIVAGIAVEHGGTASVSNGTGGGAEFVITLPV
jgi:two-component system OmpR family sensor kinase